MIRKIKEKTGHHSLNVGTMHSLFLKFLRENYKKLKFKEEPHVINNPRQNKILKDIMNGYNLVTNRGNVSYFKNNIEKYKNVGVYAEDLEGERIAEFSTSDDHIQENQGEIFLVDSKLEPFLNKIYKKLIYFFNFFRKRPI
jgi:superfamily I DNA/RNA helicase